MPMDAILESDEWQLAIRVLALSPRETEIVERILRRDDDELAIATALNMSPHTVHTHLVRLYRKLHVSTRSQLVIRIFVTYAGARGGPQPMLPRTTAVGAQVPRAVGSG